MTWFKDLRTLTKLMLSFGLIALLLVVVGYQGRSGMTALDDQIEAMYTRDVVGVSAAKDINIVIGLLGRDVRQLILETEASGIAAAKRKAAGHFAALEAAIAKSEPTFVTVEGKTTIAQLKNVLPEYRAQVQVVIDHASAGRDQEAVAALVKARATGQQLQDAAATAVEMKDRLLKQSHESSQHLYSRTQKMILAGMIVAVVLALLMGYILARLVSQPLVETVRVLEAVAGGDLTRTLDLNTKDEVGSMAAALNRAVAGMRSALLEVRASAGEVSEASTQLAAGSEELSSGAQEQASSLEETSASLEQITTSVRANADNATKASHQTRSACQAAEKGRESVSQVVSAMGAINAASKQIADIITAVDEIAFQTNLLALNAAVEAARAGEQGRGFAVVASEVRNLAQRSATAAKEIKSLITDSSRKVEAGSEMVSSSDTVLLEIVNAVKQVTDIVADIANASREQSTGIDQVSKAMVQVDTVTQQNAAQTEELSSAAQTLSSSAEHLQTLVTRFKLDH